MRWDCAPPRSGRRCWIALMSGFTEHLCEVTVGPGEEARREERNRCNGSEKMKQRNAASTPEGVSSVLFRQQQRGYRAVGFGDDPELLGLGDRVAAHQAVPIFEAQFVLGLVFLVEISPLCGIWSFLQAHVW